jgi:hypothetical protein
MEAPNGLTSRRRYRDAHELHSSQPCISRFAGLICACCADVDTLRIVKIRTERWSCRTGPSAVSCARDYYEVMRIGRINDRIGWPPMLRMLLSARTLRYLFRFSNWLTLKPGPDTLPPQRQERSLPPGLRGLAVRSDSGRETVPSRPRRYAGRSMAG